MREKKSPKRKKSKHKSKVASASDEAFFHAKRASLAFGCLTYAPSIFFV